MVTHPFINAIFDNNINAVASLLESDQDPNMKDDWHKYCCVPPLAFAIQIDHLDIAKLLIDYGADVIFGATDDFNCSSAMTSAITQNNLDAVELLIEHEHPVNKDVLLFALKCKKI